MKLYSKFMRSVYQLSVVGDNCSEKTNVKKKCNPLHKKKSLNLSTKIISWQNKSYFCIFTNMIDEITIILTPTKLSSHVIIKFQVKLCVIRFILYSYYIVLILAIGFIKATTFDGGSMQKWGCNISTWCLHKLC